MIKDYACSDKFQRGNGVILPIFSLPSKYGIGSLGKQAYRFIDFLSNSGQKYWQVLPLGMTSYGDSPYQALSDFGYNPYFIDLDLLASLGLLDELDLKTEESYSSYIDYSLLYNRRYKVLKKAYRNIDNNILLKKEFIDYINSNVDLYSDEFALFMSLKNNYCGKPWYEWPNKYKFREKASLEEYKNNKEDDINFYKFMQFIFINQWTALKAYANSKGINIIGDIPIYPAYDSLEVWCNPELFNLNEDLSIAEESGAPPDDYSSTGQLWGNPTYNWSIIENNKFDFWIRRIEKSLHIYDFLRLDHFIGFYNYWGVKVHKDSKSSAINGMWLKSCGIKLFDRLKEKLGELPIILEDLGMLSDGVVQLRKDIGFPGMAVFQFGFGQKDNKGNYETSIYQPNNYIENLVSYTSTHDSNTLIGYLKNASVDILNHISIYLIKNTNYSKDFIDKLFKENKFDLISNIIIEEMFKSSSNINLILFQDLFNMDESYRINTPGVTSNNWRFLVPFDMNYDSVENISKLLNLTIKYGRL